MNRVGGGFTAAVLSHHRTYGSVYGGSGYAAKPVYRIQYRDQPKPIPQFLRQRLIQMRRPRVPPWASAVEG
jgi:hypothetical protein